MTMSFDAVCPNCGTENRNMYLEETNGWMECECCGKSSQVMKFYPTKKLPIFRMDQVKEIERFTAALQTS